MQSAQKVAESVNFFIVNNSQNVNSMKCSTSRLQMRQDYHHEISSERTRVEVVQYSIYFCEVKLYATKMTSSVFCTRYGILRHEGDLSRRVSVRAVSSSTLGGQRSTFVSTTNTGTESASASPRCSRVVPTRPMFEPTISIE